MKIKCVSQILSFRAGKVQVYSDFDGTYCPAKHSSLHKKIENEYMKGYCSKMDNFFKQTDGDLHFHITTGRTFGEYEAVSHLLRMRGFHLPLPESFISKNGSDEFIKSGLDSDFYEKGIFPYKYTEPFKPKENKIKELTKWEGAELKIFIRNLANKYGLRFVEADSENSVKDYGFNSLYSEGKLNPDEWKKLPQKDGHIQIHDRPIADYSLGSRKDGNLKVNLIFSPDYGFCPERNYIYDNFMNEIKNSLNNNFIEYEIQWDVPSPSNHYRNTCNITPKIDGHALTKLYDTKEAFKKAILNNDMLIVAGDGSNDFKMLNPLEYIEPEEWQNFKNNSSNKEFYEGNTDKMLSDLADVFAGKNQKLKQTLEKDGFIKKLEEMPFYGIVVRKENSKLKKLTDAFGELGKVIEIENGDMDLGIKQAIASYTQKNESFKNSMSDKFKEFTLGIIKKKPKKSPVPAIILAFAGIAGCGYIISKGKRKNENLSNNL